MEITGQGCFNFVVAIAMGFFAWEANQISKEVSRVSNETSYKVSVTDSDLVFASATGILKDVQPVYVTPHFRSADNTISVGERVELPVWTSYASVTDSIVGFRNALSPNGAVCIERPNRDKCRNAQIFRLEVEYQQNGFQDTARIAGPSG